MNTVLTPSRQRLGVRQPSAAFFRVPLALCLLVAFVVFAIPSFADPITDFQSGNKLYAQGKYPEAAAAYESVLATGTASTTLWFNLGNAYFKSGQMGRAIAAYRQAQRLSPRDPDVRANLQFARNRVSGNDSVHPNVWQRALATLTIGEWTLLAALALWAWFALLAFREWKPTARRSLGGVTVLACLLMLVLGGCAGGDWFANHHSKTAVVITHDAPVKTGPIDDSQTAFSAKDGTELSVLDEREDWLQVSDSHNRIGWLKRDTAQVL